MEQRLVLHEKCSRSRYWELVVMVDENDIWTFVVVSIWELGPASTWWEQQLQCQ